MIPKINAKPIKTKLLNSTERPGGGVGGGGGGTPSLVWAKEIKLIDNNKIRVIILFICSFMGSQMYKKIQFN